MDIKNDIKEFMLSELMDNGYHAGISDDESLIDAEIMDSLGMLTLISFLGEKYDIYPDEDELEPENFCSINAICNFLDKKMTE